MEYNKDILQITSEMFRNGASVDEVCKKLNITENVFKDWKENHPHFRDIVSHGEVAAEAYWEEQLKKAALGEKTDHSPQYIMEVLVERYGWKK